MNSVKSSKVNFMKICYGMHTNMTKCSAKAAFSVPLTHYFATYDANQNCLLGHLAHANFRLDAFFCRLSQNM